MKILICIMLGNLAFLTLSMAGVNGCLFGDNTSVLAKLRDFETIEKFEVGNQWSDLSESDYRFLIGTFGSPSEGGYPDTWIERINYLSETDSQKSFTIVHSSVAGDQSGNIYRQSDQQKVATISNSDISNCKEFFQDFNQLPLKIDFSFNEFKVYPEFVCYFNNDLVQLMRNKSFELFDIQHSKDINSFQDVWEAKINILSGPNTIFSLESRANNNRQRETIIKTASAPYFVLAKYKNGFIQNCTESLNPER